MSMWVAVRLRELPRLCRRAHGELELRHRGE